jgi:hypothetical protein
MESYTSIFIVATILWTVLILYLLYLDARVRKLSKGR